jgi:hypothetical protein
VLSVRSGRVQPGIIESATQRLGRGTQTSVILGIESTKRCFDSWTDPDNSFFHAWAHQCDPKMTAKDQLRPAPRRRTARVRGTVPLHPFHRRRRRIEDLRPIRARSIVLLHLTPETRRSPFMDVSFMEIRSGADPFATVMTSVLPRN